MARAKARSIVVDGEDFVWRFAPHYEAPEEPGGFCICRDTFTAYAKGHKRSPLRITFRTWDSPIAGGPLRYGGPLFLQGDSPTGIHLHTPKWAAALIRAALKMGWQPRHTTKPHEIVDGIQFLKEMNFQQIEILYEWRLSS